ncbi:MAG: hypothetical protein KGJ23_03560 [Euryarchaeota archaeon]|nr:hypothetical protein [Euryarchaeota archaeon]MDE2046657.1 hypothetical protein [Thermoplasmata archaeon]
MVRIDLGPAQAWVCACRDEALLNDPSTLSADQEGDLGSAYLRLPPEDAEGVLRWRPAQWEALRSLLKDPMQGLSALALGALPAATQALLLDSADRELPIVIRVNRDPRVPPGPPLTLIGLRALANGAKARFEVRDVDLVKRVPRLRKRIPAAASPVSILARVPVGERETGNVRSNGDGASA